MNAGWHWLSKKRWLRRVKNSELNMTQDIGLCKNAQLSRLYGDSCHTRIQYWICSHYYTQESNINNFTTHKNLVSTILTIFLPKFYILYTARTQSPAKTLPTQLFLYSYINCNPGWARFSACQDRPQGPPSLLYNGYRVFPGGKVRPGRAADHSPPSSAAVMEEYSYTSTHPLGHNRACNGNTLPLYKLYMV